MFTTSLLLLGAIAATQAGPAAKMYDLSSPYGGDPRVKIAENLERLEIPKIAPKNPLWAYEWAASGLAQLKPNEQFRLRTVVYSQKPRDDQRASVARLLMRLWEFNMERLNTDNPSPCNSVVTVYLSFGGEPGAEQAFARDPQITQLGGKNDKVNTVYIYDLDSFKDPLQKVREVAHEFGHATLATVGGTQFITDIGGFKEPEEWAAGYMGEKLFLRWLRDQMRDGKLTSEDTLGATVDQLGGWVKAHCDPLEEAVAKNGPDFAALRGDSSKAMDSLIGLVLYMERFMIAQDLRQIFALNAQRKAWTLPAAILKNLEPKQEVTWTFPADWRGRTVWVPAGVLQPASLKPLSRKNDWIQVKIPDDGVVAMVGPVG